MSMNVTVVSDKSGATDWFKVLVNGDTVFEGRAVFVEELLELLDSIQGYDRIHSVDVQDDD